MSRSVKGPYVDPSLQKIEKMNETGQKVIKTWSGDRRYFLKW